VQHGGTHEAGEQREQRQAHKTGGLGRDEQRQEDPRDHARQHHWQEPGRETSAARVLRAGLHDVDDGHSPTLAEVLGGLSEQGSDGRARRRRRVQADPVGPDDKGCVRPAVAQRGVGSGRVGGGGHLERSGPDGTELLG